ncbi:hypothetical protein FisN_22Lh120 [Fistulifera solaris]|uniref:Myb proto-oncogene protein n=1 Tax=Fistulifera solaris TaxID=1519565 RepID=A0A1Z5JBT8_FISSO|nr:hypothetical protein FisN_22Lh120 [Fistulifera solaris]|eukprot:GAX11435.1 hypothetical protein FisN_22Lh120 [Fistulifera solaris]
MTKSSLSLDSVHSSRLDHHSPSWSCDTPSLVISIDKEAEINESYLAGSVVNSFDSAELSVDAETMTTPSSSQKAKTERQFQRWSSAEDRLLKEGVSMGDGPPHDWTKIAANHFNGMRSPRQCKSRWKNAFSPNVNYEPFTEDEDNAIVYYRQLGFGWATIASYLPGRIAEQTRDRFVNHTNPSLRTTPWTKKEDTLLIELQAKHGNRWTYISKYLPGRSENSIKNRWHNRKTRQRRALRREAVSTNAAENPDSFQSVSTETLVETVQSGQQLPSVNVDIDEDVHLHKFSIADIEKFERDLAANSHVKDEEYTHAISEV